MACRMTCRSSKSPTARSRNPSRWGGCPGGRPSRRNDARARPTVTAGDALCEAKRGPGVEDRGAVVTLLYDENAFLDRAFRGLARGPRLPRARGPGAGEA